MSTEYVDDTIEAARTMRHIEEQVRQGQRGEAFSAEQPATTLNPDRPARPCSFNAPLLTTIVPDGMPSLLRKREGGR